MSFFLGGLQNTLRTHCVFPIKPLQVRDARNAGIRAKLKSDREAAQAEAEAAERRAEARREAALPAEERRRRK